LQSQTDEKDVIVDTQLDRQSIYLSEEVNRTVMTAKEVHLVVVRVVKCCPQIARREHLPLPNGRGVLDMLPFT
jgi:hypothetical protein